MDTIQCVNVWKRPRLVKKWEPTGLLEGLKEGKRVHGMSVLLENQARQLIDEFLYTNFF